MRNPILYMGDTSLSAAAGYLAGLLTAFELGFDYVPSDVDVSGQLAAAPRKLFIVSDYPSARLGAGAQRAILDQVSAGAGLVMIGGWESYHGLGGDWDTMALGKALPVKILAQDDRTNCDQPALLAKTADHFITRGLPWEKRPPTVGGFNRMTPKAGAQTLLEVQRFTAQCRGGEFTFAPARKHAMLVVGTYGSGRTAALATDLAPHWVGGLVDWGVSRVTAQAKGSWGIEVGNYYAGFIRRLVSWTGHFEGK